MSATKYFQNGIKNLIPYILSIYPMIPLQIDVFMSNPWTARN